MRRIFAFFVLCFTALPLWAQDFRFASIDGGEISLQGYRGQPVLVTNTASMCGFTPQYNGLQKLHETYGPQGLVVLAVPSEDFKQEFGSAQEVKEFCEVNFDLTMPMTDITSVKGPDAHPFYQWVEAETGFVPRWNFNKILLDQDGQIVASYGSRTKPDGLTITREVEALLGL